MTFFYIVAALAVGYMWGEFVRGSRAQRDLNAAEQERHNEAMGRIRAESRAQFLESMLRLQRKFGRPQGGYPTTWRSALGFSELSRPTASEIKTAYRERAKAAHPDHGGSTAAMAALNLARDAGLKEIA